MKCSDLFVCLVCLGCREYYEAPDLKITALNAMLLMEGAIVLRTHRNRLWAFICHKGLKNEFFVFSKRCCSRVWDSGYSQGV